MAEITIRISDTALKVALVVVGAILPIGLVAHFWSSGMLRPKYQIQMFVPGAEDIQPGTSVRLNGMRVGSVSRVDLVKKPDNSNRRIKFELRIEQRFQNFIRDDSAASLITANLLGNRYVSIQPGPLGAPLILTEKSGPSRSES